MWYPDWYCFCLGRPHFLANGAACVLCMLLVSSTVQVTLISSQVFHDLIQTLWLKIYGISYGHIASELHQAFFTALDQNGSEFRWVILFQRMVLMRSTAEPMDVLRNNRWFMLFLDQGRIIFFWSPAGNLLFCYFFLNYSYGNISWFRKWQVAY